MKFVTFSFLVFVSWMGTFSHALETADTVFQEAQLKETGERDLDSALVLYQKTIDLSSHQPALQHQARYRLAACLEKLGKSSEALAQYKTLNGDQPEPMILTQTQMAIDRLEKALKKPEELGGSPVQLQMPLVMQNALPMIASVAPRIEKHWQLSLEGGLVAAEGPKHYQDRSTAMAWGSLGYRTTPWCEFGMELGYLTPKELGATVNGGFFLFDFKTRQTIVYAGPYIHLGHQFSNAPFSVFGQVGLGVAHQQIEFEISTVNLIVPETSFERFKATQNDFAIVSSVGLEWQIHSSLSLGAGTRLMFIAQKIQTRAETTQGVTSQETFKFPYTLVPFIRLAYRF